MSGSIAPVLTVPTLAIIQAGVFPSSMSLSMALLRRSMLIVKSSLTGINFSDSEPSPSNSIALRIHECVSVEL